MVGLGTTMVGLEHCVNLETVGDCYIMLCHTCMTVLCDITHACTHACMHACTILYSAYNAGTVGARRLAVLFMYYMQRICLYLYHTCAIPGACMCHMTAGASATSPWWCLFKYLWDATPDRTQMHYMHYMHHMHPPHYDHAP